MSRSRRPKCPIGRGCGLCGSKAWARELRQLAWDKADEMTSRKTKEVKGFDDFQDGWSQHR